MMEACKSNKMQTNFKNRNKKYIESIVNEMRRKKRAANIVIYESRDFKARNLGKNYIDKTKRSLSQQRTITSKTKTKLNN